MTFSRRIVVTIGGTEFQDDTLANVQIDMGGRTAWEQNVAGIARVLINQQDPGILINDTFTVDIESPEGVAATGGTVTRITDGGVDYIVHTFTSDGTLTVTDGGDVEYLIVAGGGGGGGTRPGYWGAGGGGAGGLRSGSSVIGSGTFPVVVGAGGSGGATGDTPTSGGDGTGSSFNGVSCTGGGGGSRGNYTTTAVALNGRAGGSGGGAGGTINNASGVGGSGVSGEGNAGGNVTVVTSGTTGYTRGAGGGGAGAAGGDNGSSGSADGGAGIASTISGASVFYAGGGGGGTLTTFTANGGVGGSGVGGDGGDAATAQDGVDGRGGGGGGGGSGSPLKIGGDGGDGIVIIRYPASKQRLFTGVVDATTAQLTEIGPLWDITASGPLTQTGRRQLTGIIAADTEGDQIALLAQDALSTAWEAAPATWAAQTRSWDGFAVDTSAIDQPGLYDLAAIDSLPANVIDELAKAAFSGSGWLYETRHGLLGYADSARRENTPEADYIVIPGNVTARNDFVTTTREGDIANVVEVTYDGGTVEAKATDSIQIYGRWDRDYETTLANQSAAEQFANRRLQLEGAPRLNVSGAIRVDLLQASDALLDKLIQIERNYGVILENVPTYLEPEGVYRGFVEGYTWSLGPDEATLNLYVSEYSLSNFGLRWAAAGPTQWNEVGASLTWNDATEALA